MKRTHLRATCLLLSLALFCVSAFGMTGCSGGGQSPSGSASGSVSSAGSSMLADGEETLPEAEAAPVEYALDGVYTTTLTAEGADLSGVTVEDVEVRYLLGSWEEAEEADGPEEKNAEVLEVSADPQGALTVKFKDPDAAGNRTDHYGVVVEKLGVVAPVPVTSKKFTVTCDRAYVCAADDAVTLTFTLNDGEYSPDVQAEDISLAGAFETLRVENVTAAGNTLTVGLSGEITFHEGSNAYLDGVVTLGPDAVPESLLPIEARIPVAAQSAYFDAERLEAADGQITVPLVLIGAEGLDALTPQDVILESEALTVESVVPAGEDEVRVTLRGEGADDKNSAAALLQNTAVTVGEREFLAGFMPADFYPVFDYVDEKDGALEITLELYANNGTFAESLDAAQVRFGGDFAGAAVTDFTRTGDTTAELIFTVPAEGQTAETIDRDGEVILSGGVLVNLWGEVKTEETAYLRNYSAESYGRSGVEGLDVMGGLSELSDITGKITGAIDFVSTAYDAVSWVLNFAGIINTEEDNVDIVGEIQRANDHLDEIERQLAAQNALLHQIMEQNIKESVGNFNALLTKIEQASSRADQYLHLAAPNFEQPVLTEDEKKGKAPIEQQAWIDYSRALVGEMREYEEYNETVQELRSDFNTAVASLQKEASVNPVCLFDQMCSMNANFDTQTIRSRVNYRYRIANVLERAVYHIILYYGYGGVQRADPVAAENYMRELETAEGTLSAYPVNFPMNQYIQEYIDFNVDGFSPRYLNMTSNEGLSPKSAPDMADRYAYCYVLNRKVNMDRFRVYTVEEYAASKSQEPVTDLTFTEEQRDEFLSRMGGRTLRQELESAFFGDGNESVVTSFATKYSHDTEDYDLSAAGKKGLVFDMEVERVGYTGSQLKKTFGTPTKDDYSWKLKAAVMRWDEKAFDTASMARDGDALIEDWYAQWTISDLTKNKQGTFYVELIGL